MIPEDFPYPEWFAAAYRQFRGAGLDPLLFDLRSTEVMTSRSDSPDTRRIGFWHRENPDIRFDLFFLIRADNPAALVSASSRYYDVSLN